MRFKLIAGSPPDLVHGKPKLTRQRAVVTYIWNKPLWTKNDPMECVTGKYKTSFTVATSKLTALDVVVKKMANFEHDITPMLVLLCSSVSSWLTEGKEHS